MQKISRDTRDRMVANFLETIGSLTALESADFGEAVAACELIGTRIRSSLEPQERGLLAVAKIILDHANTTRMT